MSNEWHDSPFRGRWKVTATWNPAETYVDPFFKDGYFNFDSQGRGDYRLDRGIYVDQGTLEWHPAIKNGEPTAEWTWNEVSKDGIRHTGEGWAAFQGEGLEGTNAYTTFAATKIDEEASESQKPQT